RLGLHAQARAARLQAQVESVTGAGGARGGTGEQRGAEPGRVDFEMRAHVHEREGPAWVVGPDPRLRFASEPGSGSGPATEAANRILENGEHECLLAAEEAVASRRCELGGQELLGNHQQGLGRLLRHDSSAARPEGHAPGSLVTRGTNERGGWMSG